MMPEAGCRKNETIAMLKWFRLDQRSVIACFNAEIIGYVQQAYPEMRTQGFPRRCMEPNTDPDFAITEKLYERMFGIGIPLSVDPAYEKQLAEDVALAVKYQIRPWLFCADDEESTKKAVQAGATNITCNNPYPALSPICYGLISARFVTPRTSRRFSVTLIL